MTLPNDPKALFHCIFCGKGKREGLRLIGGQGIYVCEECIRNSYQLLNKITEEDERRTPKAVPKPGEIKRVLDEYVVGQERAKRILSVAVYDTMQYIRCPITTICMGMAMSFGAVLLTAGSKGKRFALPHSRIMIHQPLISGGGISGQATAIEIEAKEIVDTKKRLNEIIAKHSGQTVERVAHDSDRTFYLSADEAKAYGLIDEVILRKK